MWLVAIALSLVVIATHNHYTVDVFVAWYTVPMVWKVYDGYRKDRPFPVLPSDSSDSPSVARNLIVFPDVVDEYGSRNARQDSLYQSDDASSESREKMI